MSIPDCILTNLQSLPIFPRFHDVFVPRSERSFREKRSRNDTLHFQLIPHCRVSGGLNRSISISACKVEPTACRFSYFCSGKKSGLGSSKCIGDASGMFGAKSFSMIYGEREKFMHVRLCMYTCVRECRNSSH